MDENKNNQANENPEKNQSKGEDSNRSNRGQNQQNRSGNPRQQRGQRRGKPRGQQNRGRSNQPKGGQNQPANKQQRSDSNQNRNGSQDQGKNGKWQNDRRRGQNGSHSPNRDSSQQNVPWGMNPRRTESGIQTRSQRGEFAKNWWARRWLEALERLMQGVRLSRGQHYARIGQIVSMEEIKGGVSARVQGSRSKPYRVTIQITPLNNRQWEKVFDILAEKAIYAAKLLAGEMPQDIEDVFTEAGVSLFPTRSIDLQTKCTCPDKVTPCKHIAATHYILGDRFDEDPFMIFRMRGRTQEQILEALRQRRGAEAEIESSVTESASSETPKAAPRFPETLENFWNAGHELDEVNFQVRMPAIPQPLLKRLGEPEFASQLTLQGQLEESYNAISQFAMLIAFADIANGNGNGEDDS